MTYLPTVHDQADLLDVWRHLMEPLGFSESALWMLRIAADRRVVPHLLEIPDCEHLPGQAEADGLAEVLRTLDVSEPGHSYAFLRSRPGRGGVDAGDRAFGAFLHEVGRAAGVAVEVVHLATDADVVPLPLDEIGLVRTA